MKKLINEPTTVVTDALAGIAAAHPELRIDHENKVIYRADSPVTGKVGLISGGGSGHEPLHGGFVGFGMLDAACAGEVFTSPTPDQMYEATKLVDGGAGVLHIVKNYTGDILNFEMAAEMAGEVKVETIVTNDDVAVADSLYTAGRRGVGVTVLLEKICGAAAEAGADLASVAAIARKVNGWGRSMGVALTSCTVPAAGKPTFELAENEMEIGIGIHGEPGRYREPLGTAAEIAERLLEPIVSDLPYERGDAVWPSSTGWAAHHCSSSTSCSPRCRGSSTATASASNARSSARTSPHWRWPDARSRCSSSMKSWSDCGTRRSAPRHCGGGCEQWPPKS